MVDFFSNIGKWILMLILGTGMISIPIFFIIEIIKFSFPNLFSSKCENSKCELYELCNGCEVRKIQETQTESNKTSYYE